MFMRIYILRHRYGMTWCLWFAVRNYVHARVSALSQTHKSPMTRSEFVGWDKSENNGYAIGYTGHREADPPK